MQPMQNGQAAAYTMHQHAEQEDSAAFWRAWLSANLKGSQLDEPQQRAENGTVAANHVAAVAEHGRCVLLLCNAAAAVE
jgi:hypothetical protein